MDKKKGGSRGRYLGNIMARTSSASGILFEDLEQQLIIFRDLNEMERVIGQKLIERRQLWRCSSFLSPLGKI
jgi:hypothetical protein